MYLILPSQSYWLVTGMLIQSTNTNFKPFLEQTIRPSIIGCTISAITSISLTYLGLQHVSYAIILTLIAVNLYNESVFNYSMLDSCIINMIGNTFFKKDALSLTISLVSRFAMLPLGASITFLLNRWIVPEDLIFIKYHMAQVQQVVAEVIVVSLQNMDNLDSQSLAIDEIDKKKNRIISKVYSVESFVSRNQFTNMMNYLDSIEKFVNFCLLFKNFAGKKSSYKHAERYFFKKMESFDIILSRQYSRVVSDSVGQVNILTQGDSSYEDPVL